MISTLINDLNFTVHSYGTAALAVGTLAVPGIYGITRQNAIKCVNGALLVAYLYIVLQVTLLSRSPAGVHIMGTSLFGVYDHLTRYLAVHFAENFLLFFPLGILFPMNFRLVRFAFFGLLSGFVLSFFIESVQFVTTLGSFELHDILMNGLGFAAGYIIWRILR